MLLALDRFFFSLPEDEELFWVEFFL